MPHMPGFGSWMIIAVIGLLFFGKRLPEVGRSLGKGIVEFKKGLKGIEDEVDTAVEESSRPKPALPAQTQANALPSDAKFDPYTGKPVETPRFDPYTGKPLGNSETVVSAGQPRETVGTSDH
ncbi:MAG: twin arginine-targeting protein translocase, TatA/E family [Phycisphaerales bacterium]|jgi:sec-independent protein translocase protein TatA|nr:twin arginine-targeting protein translocase, TatA/E family [Phycisphaerales bacterium]MDB5300366.1 twin arginine-targeting protein translocase, TatA/E family [Phycisphaerales bacterium]MDB5302787.1 twin arginine-targeting protein translocase, TatA/E family [Phycisphaerales bacterium]